jgi:hypothetical protein
MTEKKQDALPFVDVPNAREHYVDCVVVSYLDPNSLLRIDFGTSRLGRPEEEKPGEEQTDTPPSGKTYTTCRLAISPRMALDLQKHVNSLVSQLEQRIRSMQPRAPDETQQ